MQALATDALSQGQHRWVAGTQASINQGGSIAPIATTIKNKAAAFRPEALGNGLASRSSFGTWDGKPAG